VEVTLNETKISLICDSDWYNLYGNKLFFFKRELITIQDMINLYENKNR
jgi:hypothetical protein